MAELEQRLGESPALVACEFHDGVIYLTEPYLTDFVQLSLYVSRFCPCRSAEHNDQNTLRRTHLTRGAASSRRSGPSR